MMLFFAFVCVITYISVSNGFSVTPTISSTSHHYLIKRSHIQLGIASVWNAFTNRLRHFDDEKESNRKFRRTIYNKHDWKKHRSGNRYFAELNSMPRSVVLRGLVMQALSVTIFSALIVAYNDLIASRFLPKFFLLTSPPLPFTLTSSALGLLLVFRTNAAYSRWRDARIAWAIISAKSFDIMRESITWIDEDTSTSNVSLTSSREEKIEHANFIKSKICRYIVAYGKCLKWQLGQQGDDRRLIEDLNGVLDHKELEGLLAARHRPQHILSQTTHFLKASGLPANLQAHIDRSVCDITVSMTTCERIYTTPIPLVYTRHTARFLFLWLLAMPMTLYHEYAMHQKWMVPFISFVQAIFLFGIEELGVQIEEPFSILPLANICSDIHRTGEELLYDAGIPWFGCSDEHHVVIEEEKPSTTIAAISHSTASSISSSNSSPEYLYAFFNATSMPASVDRTASSGSGGENKMMNGGEETVFRIPID